MRCSQVEFPRFSLSWTPGALKMEQNHLLSGVNTRKVDPASESGRTTTRRTRAATARDARSITCLCTIIIRVGSAAYAALRSYSYDRRGVLSALRLASAGCGWRAFAFRLMRVPTRGVVRADFCEKRVSSSPAPYRTDEAHTGPIDGLAGHLPAFGPPPY